MAILAVLQHCCSRQLGKAKRQQQRHLLLVTQSPGASGRKGLQQLLNAVLWMNCAWLQ